MNDNQMRDLIFRPGFSTRADVTDTSGRGVGLDAVRAAVEALQGRIEVASTQRQGTRFMLTLPVELGSSPVLVVRVFDQMMGLPMLAVEATQLTAHERPAHQPAARPAGAPGAAACRWWTWRPRLGLRAATLPGEGQPLMIIQQRWQARGARGGLGGGRQGSRHPPAARRGARRARLPGRRHPEPWRADAHPPAQLAGVRSGPGEPVAAEPRALVVDDSLTARALHRAMLEAGGFTVHLASTGVRALERLQTDSYDVDHL